jgi:4-alpha-glucanotransferase
MKRICGVLLHPTSLPGTFGIGDLGPWAYRFADWLAAGGQTLWQVLPVGPPGYGNSPYQAYSSMAGNPLLISLERLADDGLLPQEAVADVPDFPRDRVDFEAVASFKWHLLRQAAESFLNSAAEDARREFEEFCRQKHYWLDTFSRFAALKQQNNDANWPEWAPGLEPDPHEVEVQKFIQFEFSRQWTDLRRYCNERGISIMGDIPIFVAHNSADVWGHPDLFDLDERGYPRTIAGVPPDYFSATGQCWGNPLYRWDVMEQSEYGWWVHRVQSILDQVDLVRLDHFRGFEKYYEIPAGATTAVDGRWVEGPGDRFFARLKEVFGTLPFVAEDLGLITEEVHALRDRWEFPGMRVLQFAFGNPACDDPFKPHNFIRNCVVYTGTHDNDTTAGWLRASAGANNTQSEEQLGAEREFALRYVQSDGSEIHWDFIRLAVASVAEIAVYPMQDVLGLGSDARMNVPATTENNWAWRCREEYLDPRWSARLRTLARTYGRADC